MTPHMPNMARTYALTPQVHVDSHVDSHYTWMVKTNFYHVYLQSTIWWPIANSTPLFSACLALTVTTSGDRHCSLCIIEIVLLTPLRQLQSGGHKIRLPGCNPCFQSKAGFHCHNCGRGKRWLPWTTLSTVCDVTALRGIL